MPLTGSGLEGGPEGPEGGPEGPEGGPEGAIPGEQPCTIVSTMLDTCPRDLRELRS